jgi:Spy/CpxP family protein refolding chaperone
MKKKLLMLGLVAICTSSMAFACPDFDKCPPPQGGPQGCNRPECGPQNPPKCNIEQKLKLTEAQKQKAEEIRKTSREQMRPIMQAIKTKQEQKEIIKNNHNMTAEAQCEQIEKLNAQISDLKKQAHDLRVKNEKEFESILTQKQKTELNKIKEQARKDMTKNGKGKKGDFPPAPPKK